MNGLFAFQVSPRRHHRAEDLGWPSQISPLYFSSHLSFPFRVSTSLMTLVLTIGLAIFVFITLSTNIQLHVRVGREHSYSVLGRVNNAGTPYYVCCTEGGEHN